MTASQARIFIKIVDAKPEFSIEFEGVEIVSPDLDDDRNTEPRSAVSHELTPRQLDVLREIVKGEQTKAIARNLGLSEGTVKIHLKSLFKALGVRTRSAAAVAGLSIIRDLKN